MQPHMIFSSENALSVRPVLFIYQQLYQPSGWSSARAAFKIFLLTSSTLCILVKAILSSGINHWPSGFDGNIRVKFLDYQILVNT